LTGQQALPLAMTAAAQSLPVINFMFQFFATIIAVSAAHIMLVVRFVYKLMNNTAGTC